MQKTSHLHLNTWVEDDPVDLDQINENFTLLDADAAAKSENDQKHKAALATLALHTAHRALEAHHANTRTGASDNLILADFSKPDDWSSVSNVHITQNTIETSAGTYTGYSKSLDRHYLSAEWSTFETFEALETGKLTAISVDLRQSDMPANYAYADFRILDGDTVVAEYPNACMRELPTFTDCTVFVGHTYCLQARSNEEHQMSIVGDFSVTIEPTVAENGFVNTKETSADGSTVYVWLTFSGALPSVSAVNHGGLAERMQLFETKIITDLSGQSQTRAGYRLENYTYETVRIHVRFVAQTSLSSVCGVVI